MAESAVLEAEYEQVTLEGLRPAAIGVAVLMSLLVPVDLLELAPGLRLRAVGVDGLTVLVAALLWWAAGRKLLSQPWAAPAGVLFALLLLANVLLDRGSLGDGVSQLSVAVILVGLGSFLLPRRWMVCGLFLVALGWLASLTGSGAHPGVARTAFTLLAPLTVAIPIHFARRRSHQRLFELRARDASQKTELTRALRAAEELSRTLDEKVAARTTELSQTAGELRIELAERQRAGLERAALEARLQHDALHDALTGLANRALFLNRLNHAWQRTRREPGFRFAVLYLDLDRFKAINDTFGHETGDQLLVGIGKRLPQGTIMQAGRTN